MKILSLRYIFHSRLDIELLHLALAAQGVLVKQVLCHLVVVGIHAGEVGDVVTQLLDGLHLLVQVVGLQEVAHMGVCMLGGQLVQVQQSLVDVLLQLQSALHGLQPAPPLITFRFLDVLQEDASPSVVLEGQQLVSMLPLLVAVLLEEVGKAWEGHIVTGEVEGL